MTNICRKLWSIFFAVAFFFALVLPGSLLAQEGETIRSVEIVGNKRVDEPTIRYYIKSKVGTPLSRSQIRRDIEQIYSLNQFKDIQVETHSTPDGVQVVFRVEEILAIGDVRIEGDDKIDSIEVWKVIKDEVRRGATFHEHLIASSTDKISNFYHDKGYFFVKVKVDTKVTPENLVEMVIHIDRGDKVSIEKIRFFGNKHFKDKVLIDKMETKATSWLSWLDDSGIYKKDLLKLDMFRIETFYHDNGFIKVRVLDPKVDIDEKAKAIYINIPVEEGPQYRVGKVEVAGDETVSKEEIFKVIKIKTGDIYNVSLVREDVLNISELYSQRGYAYADVNPKSKINEEDKTADMSLEVDKGRQVYVGEVTILGNTRTRDNVIRREFRLKEGDLFDSEKLKRTKQRINNLQYFNDVKVDTRRGKEPDQIDITTTVTERPTGTISVGAGFSSVENLIFNASISQDNLFGTGKKLKFITQLSSIRSDFDLSYTDPRIFDSEILFGADLFNTDQDFFSFRSRNRGAGIRLGRILSEYESVALKYRFDDVLISGVDSAQETDFLRNEKRNTSRIAPSYTYDSRDDFLNPSNGWRHVIKSDIAGGPLGGTDFVKFGYEVIKYTPLFAGLVFAAHAEVNWADGYSGDTLPAFERFFMGGPSSLRGYTVRDVGPKDSSGNPIGGNQSLLFNLELQYPFTKAFRGFLFYDRGNVFGSGPLLNTTVRHMDLGEMRSSFGAGIRFLSPFGPIGFAYGIKLDPKEGEKKAEFHFSAGSAF
ncbi:MAG: outer membrane protein assembly factor BamA [Nitrospinae bacterium CG11_big_fil_rev_8_21_14_0_20_56_8]|nr:MAG: outer membrane protein assembly factor BamA [Nitrospinae bacterium CG11_big_fil_rev_8_21_14_0_20_56_8]